MSLLTPDVSMVRATYTTPRRRYKLNPAFLQNLEKGEPKKPISSQPRMVLVDFTNLVPRLTSSELKKIDPRLQMQIYRQP